MEVVFQLSEQVGVAFALLSDAERDLVVQKLLRVDIYDVKAALRDVLTDELFLSKGDLDVVARLAAAHRILEGEDITEEHSKALVRAA